MRYKNPRLLYLLLVYLPRHTSSQAFVKLQCLEMEADVCKQHAQSRLAVWLSGNALASINVVVLRQTWLVPGWVTICGQVNHLGM